MNSIQNVKMENKTTDDKIFSVEMPSDWKLSNNSSLACLGISADGDHGFMYIEKQEPFSNSPKRFLKYLLRSNKFKLNSIYLNQPDNEEEEKYKNNGVNVKVTSIKANYSGFSATTSYIGYFTIYQYPVNFLFSRFKVLYVFIPFHEKENNHDNLIDTIKSTFTKNKGIALFNSLQQSRNSNNDLAKTVLYQQQSSAQAKKSFSRANDEFFKEYNKTMEEIYNNRMKTDEKVFGMWGDIINGEQTSVPIYDESGNIIGYGPKYK